MQLLIICSITKTSLSVASIDIQLFLLYRPGSFSRSNLHYKLCTRMGLLEDFLKLKIDRPLATISPADRWRNTGCVFFSDCGNFFKILMVKFNTKKINTIDPRKLMRITFVGISSCFKMLEFSINKHCGSIMVFKRKITVKLWLILNYSFLFNASTSYVSMAHAKLLRLWLTYANRVTSNRH